MWWVLIGIGVYLILREQGKPGQTRLVEILQPRLIPVSSVSNPIPHPTTGLVLRWNMTALDADARVSIAAGETKIFIARVTNNIRGFELDFYPMMDFTVSCTFRLPLKPDGSHYSTKFNSVPNISVVEDSSGTIISGFWATYELYLKVKIWSAALAGMILDPYIYPGDFILTMTADRAGYGFMTTPSLP